MEHVDEREKDMAIHEFTVTATGLPVDGAEWEYAFYEAGCDDATVMLTGGHFLLFFDREAVSYDDAVRTAREDIERAGAKVISMEAGNGLEGRRPR